MVYVNIRIPPYFLWFEWSVYYLALINSNSKENKTAGNFSLFYYGKVNDG